MNELDQHFKKAYEFVNEHVDLIPKDTLLRLYACYKNARPQRENPKKVRNLINAFKSNALLQLGYISKEDAKKTYINIVDNELGYLRS